jgi:hypothetical protein
MLSTSAVVAVAARLSQGAEEHIVPPACLVVEVDSTAAISGARYTKGTATTSDLSFRLTPDTVRSVQSAFAALSTSLSSPTVIQSAITTQTRRIGIYNALPYDITVSFGTQGPSHRVQKYQERAVELELSQDHQSVLTVHRNEGSEQASFLTALLHQGGEVRIGVGAVDVVILQCRRNPEGCHVVIHPPTLIRSRLIKPCRIAIQGRVHDIPVTSDGANTAVLQILSQQSITVHDDDATADCNFSSTSRQVLDLARSETSSADSAIIVLHEQVTISDGFTVPRVAFHELVTIANNTGAALSFVVRLRQTHDAKHPRVVCAELSDGQDFPCRAPRQVCSLIFEEITLKQPTGTQADLKTTPFEIGLGDPEREQPVCHLQDTSGNSLYLGVCVQRVAECADQLVVSFHATHWIFNRTEFPVSLAKDARLSTRTLCGVGAGVSPTSGSPFVAGFKSSAEHIASGQAGDQVRVVLRTGDDFSWSEAFPLMPDTAHARSMTHLVCCKAVGTRAAALSNCAVWVRVVTLGENVLTATCDARSVACSATWRPPTTVTVSPLRMLVNRTSMSLHLTFGTVAALSKQVKSQIELRANVAVPCSDVSHVADGDPRTAIVTIRVHERESNAVVALVDHKVTRALLLSQTGESLTVNCGVAAGGMRTVTFETVGTPSLWIENRLSSTVTVSSVGSVLPGSYATFQEVTSGQRSPFNFPMGIVAAARQELRIRACETVVIEAMQQRIEIDCSKPIGARDFCCGIAPLYIRARKDGSDVMALTLTDDAPTGIDRVLPSSSHVDFTFALKNLRIHTRELEMVATIRLALELRDDAGATCLVCCEIDSFSVSAPGQTITTKRASRLRWLHDTCGASKSDLNVRDCDVLVSDFVIDVDDTFIADALRDVAQVLAAAQGPPAAEQHMLSASRFHRNVIEACAPGKQSALSRVKHFDHIAVAAVAVELTLRRQSRTCFSPWLGAYGALLPPLTRANLKFAPVDVIEREDGVAAVKEHVAQQVASQWFRLTSVGNAVDRYLR